MNKIKEVNYENVVTEIKDLMEEIRIIGENKFFGSDYGEKIKRLMYLRRRQIQLNKKRREE
jgi:hypothetical protein